MTSRDLESVAQTLVSEGKGILAADETTPTLTRRFDTLRIQSTEQSRRTYREMLFTSPGAAEFISGVIMYDETIRQKSASGAPLAEALTVAGILPGIKVDTGAKPLAGSPDETVTEGLDGLRDRLRAYHGMGARFAKWRAVIHVTDILPSSACVRSNAHALARYASLCQEQKLVPIVEPEVLMEGSHKSSAARGSPEWFSTLFSMPSSSKVSRSKECCSNRTWFSQARSATAKPLRRRSRPRLCAACAGTCLPRCLELCSSPAANKPGSRPFI
jgi:fructose-bisphosphate aldolase class 1